ncbi:MAG: OadG family transporter subunit [Eubacteriales bacterium]|nr:OadG family transporter subunit [Eubacteriales bacterium]
MKHIFKKLTSVCTALFCAAAVTVGGAAMVMAETEIDEALEQQITMTAEGLTETIIPLSDDEIEQYMSSGDSFTMQAMEAWKNSKEELGEKKDEEGGKTEVAGDHGQYTVTIPVKFEKADANFVYVFDDTAIPTSMSVDVQYPLSVTLERAGLNTLMGLGTVFIMLIFLSFVIYLFRFIPGLVEGKKKNAAVVPESAIPAPAPVPAVEAVEPAADDTELIAVISAAIAASEGTSTDGFVVRSIRKINRKKGK